MDELVLGTLATEHVDTRAFLDTVFDRETGAIAVPRTGRIWEAIRTARLAGGDGSGVTVAVIDGEFDLSMLPADRVHAASTVPESTTWGRRHGTIVALLILAVAPKATLLLVDAMYGSSVHPQRVADGIALAKMHRAAVVNLSLEFASDCALRDTGWMDVEVLTSIDPDPAGFLAQVEHWASTAAPYSDDRCRRACRVCDALAQLPDEILVVAASANKNERSCPACFRGAVGVGFHRERRIVDNGVVFTDGGLAETETVSLVNPELLVDEPPGFLGTSFASPLLAGLGALVEHPADIASMAALPHALFPTANLIGMFARADGSQITGRARMTLDEGQVAFSRHIPERHRHGELAGPPAPCAICALLASGWYDQRTSFLLATGAYPEAMRIGRTAAAIAPLSASSAANLGEAAARWSRTDVSAAERASLVDEAFHSFTRAAELSDEPSYAARRDALAAQRT